MRNTFKQAGIPDKAAIILATWFGTGLVPIASGTFGTLGAFPLALWLQHAGSVSKCLIVFGSIGAAVWAADRSSRMMGRKDPSQVVVDEVAGYLTTAALLPAAWTSLILGFFLFRLFDIWKPFPVRHMERLPGGIGIVTDDVAAGVYAALAVRVVMMIHNVLF